jgi:hypothetical protein
MGTDRPRHSFTKNQVGFFTFFKFSLRMRQPAQKQLAFCELSEFKDGMAKTCSDQYHRQDLKMRAFVVKIIKYICEGLPRF